MGGLTIPRRGKAFFYFLLSSFFRPLFSLEGVCMLIKSIMIDMKWVGVVKGSHEVEPRFEISRLVIQSIAI